MTTVTQILNQARKYIGVAQGSATHKAIIDKYNSVKPLPVGYPVKYSDDWCDAFITTLAIETGSVDIIGRECGVQRHIDIFKQKGIWIEDGRITPKPGDIITFNWDEYTQANDGFADHIGIVESVKNGVITTIEGNTDRSCKRRTYQVGNGYIRGFARPKYKAATSTTPSKQKSVTDLAHEVISGKHGTGDARKKALGSRYSAVQAKVNELLKSTAKKKTNAQVAREIYLGQGGWGNGTTRINKLKAAGYDPNVIQKLLNKMF